MRRLAAVMLFVAAAFSASAQDSNTIRLYLDCGHACDQDFIKTEIYKVTLREDAPLADEPGVRVLSRAGSVSELAVFGRDRMQELKTSGKISGAEICALDLDSAFKALLGE